MTDTNSKPVLRRELRDRLSRISEADRHVKSTAACKLIADSAEFAAARVVMLFLSVPTEVDTASLALRCWQEGKTVAVPKVSWDQRRMLPTEISSLKDGLTNTGLIREPIAGKPVPIEFIDLVIVPGLGFTGNGYRIGRGMGFYDRFLALPEFQGLSCGLAFEEQVISDLPILDHDVPLSMLATERTLRRFALDAVTGGGR